MFLPFPLVIYFLCPAMEKALKVLESLVRLIMGDDPVHGYPHVSRVKELCRYLARGMGSAVNMRVLEAAALLHDIGRVSEDYSRSHAEISAEVAGLLLPHLGFSEKEVEEVRHAILAHSFSLGVKPRTMEAMILSDADKLDAMGAVGVARAFMESGRRGRSFEETVRHFEEKLLKLRGLMNTEEGRRLAEERHRFMALFLERFLEEVGNTYNEQAPSTGLEE